MLSNAVLAYLVARCTAAADPQPPSVVFMMLDDVGWADFEYIGSNKTVARTPHVDAFAHGIHSVILRDMHSGGTVCSPTRATVLTGRHEWRDCVHSVYGCSDCLSCPKGDPGNDNEPFQFNENIFTIAHAVKESNAKHGTNYTSKIFGKW